MSAFLYLDWTIVASAAAAASIFASVWMSAQREKRELEETENARQRRIGELQTEVSSLRREVDRLREVVIDHAKKLKTDDGEHG